MEDGMKKTYVGSWAAQFDDQGILWLSDFNLGGLYKCDLNNRKLELEHFFNNGRLIQEALHRDMVIMGDDIILLPLNDSAIRMYNKKSKKERAIELSELEGTPIILRLEKTIWIVIENTVYRLEYEKECLEIDEYLTKEIFDIKNDFKGTIRLKASDSIIVWCDNANEIYSIDPFRRERKTIPMPVVKGEIMDIYNLKSKLWVLFYDTYNILSIDDKHQVKEYTSLERDERFKRLPYSGIAVINGELILPNYYGRYSMRVDEKNGVLMPIFETRECDSINILDYGAYYYRVIGFKNRSYFIPQRGKMIYKCDERFSVIDEFEMKAEIDNRFLKHLLVDNASDNGRIINENTYGISLKRYISFLSEVDLDREAD